MNIDDFSGCPGITLEMPIICEGWNVLLLGVAFLLQCELKIISCTFMFGSYLLYWYYLAGFKAYFWWRGSNVALSSPSNTVLVKRFKVIMRLFKKRYIRKS